MVLKIIMVSGIKMKTCSCRSRTRPRLLPSLFFCRYEQFFLGDLIVRAIAWAFLFVVSAAEALSLLGLPLFVRDSWQASFDICGVVFHIALAAVFAWVLIGTFRCLVQAVCAYRGAKAYIREHEITMVGIFDLIEATAFEDDPGRGRSWWVLSSLLSDGRASARFSDLAAEQKMVSICARSAMANGWFCGNLKQAVFRRYEENENRRVLAREATTQFARRAKENGIRYAVMKGSALEWVVYPDKDYRDVGDIDILVHPDDIDAAHSVLLSLGYAQSCGPTSVSSQIQAKAVAALSLADGLGDGGRTISMAPVRRHQYGDQIAPYRKKDHITFELHDSVRGLSSSSADLILSNHIVEHDGYFATDPVTTFVLLVSAAYQNSESFCSVLFDRSATVRDYYELKLILMSNRPGRFWLDARNLILLFGMQSQWSVVQHNYGRLYDADNIPRVLRSIDPEPSRWGIDLATRLREPQIARIAALKVFRDDLRVRAKRISSASSREKLNFYPVFGAGEVSFSVLVDSRGAWVFWRFSRKLCSSESIALECACYPLESDEEMTSLKICLIGSSGKWRALAHESDRFSEDLFLRESGIACEVAEECGANEVVLSVRIDQINEVLISGLRNGSVALHPGMFRRAQGNVFWRAGPRAVLDEFRLLGTYIATESTEGD